MTDDTTPPPPETGWPSADRPPSWAEPEAMEETSEEDAYDAWLEAQAGEPAAPEEPAAVEEPSVPASPVEAWRQAFSAVETSAPMSQPEQSTAEADEAGPSAIEPEPEPEPEGEAEPPSATDSGTTTVSEPDPEPEPAAAAAFEADAHVDRNSSAAAPAPAAMAQLSGVPGTRSAVAFVAPLVAAAVLLAALATFLAVWAHSSRGGGDAERARRDALASARNAARLVFSYDYRHLDKDFAAGKALTTGKFAGDYTRTTSKLVDDVAARYKAVVVADVSDAAVISASRSRVVTLVFLNQRSTSSLAAGQKITQSRITMVLVHKGGNWLVSEVKAF
jgi:Mce-associated membrane protein